MPSVSRVIRSRERSREEIGNFVEVYCYCPLEVLIERDVKGMYKKAIAGEIQNFTGISDPYEEPENPEFRIDSSTETLEESVVRVLTYLEEHGYVPPAPTVDDGGYTAEEERLIEERLGALGYL